MANYTNKSFVYLFCDPSQDLFKIGYATFLSDLTNQVLKETSSNDRR